MSWTNLTPRRALILFAVLTLIIFAQAVWWVIFMARLTDEKVTLTRELGGALELVDEIHQQEINRQIMVGTEGVFLLVATMAGAWLIYRSLRKSEELQFRQQNFLMAVTHELRTPLASLKLYTDTLQSERISAERKAQVIPKMKQDIAELESMVGDILEASRFDRRDYRLRLRPVDLTALLVDRIDHLKSKAFRFEVDSNLVDQTAVCGDPDALRRVIDAVLDNAVRYSSGQSASISLNMSVGDDQIILTITDNGIGIDSKDLPRIFERFYRAGGDRRGSRQGSGLGLYLAREIIRAHGGSIDASSEGPGRGCTITIKLPRGSDYEGDTAG